MKNIKDRFYLSEEGNAEKLSSMAELAMDEIENIVGRFDGRSHRSGKLKGEVLVGFNGEIIIRHHFNKKTLWEGQSELA